MMDRLIGNRVTNSRTLSRLGQFRLDHAPSLFQCLHLSFRRGDDLLRERCEQRLKPLVSADWKHPVVLPVVLEHRIGPRRTFDQRLNGHGKVRNDSFQLLRDAARVDDAVMQTSEGWARLLRGQRNIGDFSRWKEHDSYQKSLERLMRDLRVKQDSSDAPETR